MILATATPAVVVLVRDARPPILAGGCLVIVAIWTAMWARQDSERMLPGSRREQLWSMAVLGPIIALIALVDLAV
ncbi:MAG: hypothetical protein KatS3mg103_0598 [Phycisphaerales bacterium]|nr:MAG: hypothetical protein KatS3mg103_0598 [Phycisphaerales bacterium]